MLMALSVAAGALGWILLRLIEQKRQRPVTRQRVPRRGGTRTQLPDSDAELLVYDQLHVPLPRMLLSLIGLSGALFATGWLFFNNAGCALVLSAGCALAVKQLRRGYIRKRKSELKLQFKYALSALAASLAAGRSIEKAWASAMEDVAFLYPDPRYAINRELALLNRRLQNGETVETAVHDLAERANIEEIHQFSDVFRTCNRSGGDLIQVIRRTAAIIAEKIEIQQEIQVTVAAKRMESRLMQVVPFAILGFLRFSSYDYMEPLYHGSGLFLMGGGLLCMAGCMVLTNKIMDIDI